MDIEERLIIASKIEDVIKDLKENKGKITSFILITTRDDKEDLKTEVSNLTYQGGYYTILGLLTETKSRFLNDL